MENKLYLMKDLSDLSGFSSHTIKYYLKRGLIKETGRSRQTNFRFFSDKTLEELSRIKEYRRRKLSLDKIFVLMREGA